MGKGTVEWTTQDIGIGKNELTYPGIPRKGIPSARPRRERPPAISGLTFFLHTVYIKCRSFFQDRGNPLKKLKIRIDNHLTLRERIV